MALLEIRDLKKYFPVHNGPLRRDREHVKAIDGVSLDVEEGETVGLVGESGCGKSSLGRCLVRLIEPSGGTVTFEGHDLSALSGSAMREMRRKMQMIFQDPYASLNPRMRVGDIIGEGLRIHGQAKGRDLKLRVLELLKKVGLREEYYGRYPHEFSGGQRQRIGLARALAVNAKFIVADEAVSALDVSIQARDSQHAARSAAGAWAHLPVHLARPARGRAHERSRGGHVSRQDRRDRAVRGTSHRQPASLYPGSAFSGARCRSRTQRRAHHSSGRCAEPDQPAVRVQLPPRCPYALGRCSEEEPLLEFDGRHGVACHVFGPGGKK